MKLRELLADNMREYRRRLGLSQAALARKAGSSTNFIAMIELGRKFPSVEMLERIATALEIEAQELFSQPPSATGALHNLRQEVLAELQPLIQAEVQSAVEKAVTVVVEAKLKTLG